MVQTGSKELFPFCGRSAGGLRRAWIAADEVFGTHGLEKSLEKHLPESERRWPLNPEPLNTRNTRGVETLINSALH